MSGSGALLLVLLTASQQASAKASSKAQQRCVVEAVYMESRDQPLKGQVAVRDVVRNRAKKLKKNFCSVVYSKHQFEWVAKLKPPVVELSEYKRVLSSKPVLTDDYLYFFRKDMPRPPWSKRMDCKIVIADHRFCKDTS